MSKRGGGDKNIPITTQTLRRSLIVNEGWGKEKDGSFRVGVGGAEQRQKSTITLAK